MISLPDVNKCTVAVIGLGYVGLPLAVEFAKPQNSQRTKLPMNRRVIGFDIDQTRLTELSQGIERTKEISSQELGKASLLEFSNDKALLAQADVFVITVPTPIDSAKRPDLSPLERATSIVSQALKDRSKTHVNKASITTPVIIFESTVYPGATEEVCVPILEEQSGLIYNQDFLCGYSPERINPGDKEHRLTTITKVTSGSTAEAANWVDDFYGSIVKAGTHKAPNLKVAEAAKVIENTQRDLNIALVNELAIIFNRLGIDTLDVLEAAGTKWNFLPFRPGLVGGHCIGVDPYYLTHKSEQLGYHPQVVLAGRRINDGMGSWVVEKLVLAMAQRRLAIGGAKVLILGLSFKENCADLRNTKVIDVINSLECYGMTVTVVDPWVNPIEAEQEYGIKVLQNVPNGMHFSAVIYAVAHQQFKKIQLEDWLQLLEPNAVSIDLKGLIPRSINPIRI